MDFVTVLFFAAVILFVGWSLIRLIFGASWTTVVEGRVSKVTSRRRQGSNLFIQWSPYPIHVTVTFENGREFRYTATALRYYDWQVSVGQTVRIQRSAVTGRYRLQHL